MPASITVEVEDECGGRDTLSLSIDPTDTDADIMAAAESECEEWCRGGEWGTDGARIDCWYTVPAIDPDDRVGITVEIDIDHEALIHAAAGTAGCGTDPDDHDWTSEGEGGCRENPGVWSTGGTSLSISDHCRTCGLHRTRRHTGSQRNPGEHDTVTYTMLESEAE